jgi:type VI secretion system secreted protein VgrG
MRRTPFLLVLLACPAAAVQPSATLAVEGAAPIAISRLEGEEALSALFHFDIELVGNVPFETLLGKEVVATLPLPDGGTRYFAGICSRVSQGQRQTVEIVPRLWLLTRESRSRMFQSMSVPEIVAAVLAESGIESDQRLLGDFPSRDCVVQRNETDFAFISRLMEEEGIFYFFTHSPTGHSMVLANTPQAHPSLPQGGTVRWLGGSPKAGHGVTEWTKTQELRTGKVTLSDYTFTFPREPLLATGLIQESVAVGAVTHRLRLPVNQALEVFDFPGRYAQRFDGVDGASLGDFESEAARTAEIRAGEETARALFIEGAGDVGQLTSGHTFVFAGHFNANGQYVVTAARHTWSLLPSRKGFDVRTAFTAIPIGLPFRPARVTPRPVLVGVENAVVTGPAGSTTHTDSLGRIKVKFPWLPDGASDENSSCWIRVGALHAGQQNGWTLVPEVGEEVLVAFEHGDPDRPVVIGSVWNADRRPPERRPPE